MTPTAPTPRLTALQKTWLQEIGLPKAMLKRYSPQAVCMPSVSPSLAPPAAPVPVLKPSSNQGEGLHKIAIDMPAIVGLRKGMNPATKETASAGQPDSVAAGAAIVARTGELPTDLVSLEASAQQCRACVLCQRRSHVVFGAGVEKSPTLMVIGEAPGDQDDRTGLPFQGDAGRLLTQMLCAIGVDQASSVYFANLVKCRPLGNRPPSGDEIAACLPFLQRQIALIKPRHMMVLGRVAVQTLVGSDADFDALRAGVHTYCSEDGEPIPMLVSYHPAYLLLQPQHKLDAWRDLDRLRGVLADGVSGSCAGAGSGS